MASKKVAGVLVAKADEKVIDESLAELKLPKGGTLDEKIERIAKKMKAAKECADCETCGGDSDVDLSRCPYCGDGELVDAKSAKIAKAGSSKVVSESDLDESVTLIRRLSAGVRTSLWSLGREIARNHDLQLWKLRKDGKGVVKWKSFNQFCTGELGMSHTHAFKLANVSREFTEKQVTEVGPTKLGVILQLPAAKREEAVKAAKAGASKTQLQQLKDSPAAAKVTVALSLAKTILPLMAKTAKGDEPKPAKRIGDKPFAEEELSNGVVRTYRVIVHGDDTLSLAITSARRK